MPERWETGRSQKEKTYALAVTPEDISIVFLHCWKLQNWDDIRVPHAQVAFEKSVRMAGFENANVWITFFPTIQLTRRIQLRISNGACGWGSDVILHTATTCHTSCQAMGYKHPEWNQGQMMGSPGQVHWSPHQGWGWQWGSCACCACMCLVFWNSLRLPAQLGWKSKTTPIKQNLSDKFSHTLPISIWCETPWQWGSLVTCLQVHC